MKKLLKVGTFRGYFSADDARPGDVSFAASGRKDGRRRIGLNWQRLTGSVRIHLIYLQRMGRSGFGRNLRIDLRSKRRNRWHVRMIWRIRLGRQQLGRNGFGRKRLRRNWFEWKRLRRNWFEWKRLRRNWFGWKRLRRNGWKWLVSRKRFTSE